MSTRQILVTPYVTVVPRERGSMGNPRLRYRWRAELVFDNRPSFAVEGHKEPDAAIGALIREAVTSCETHDEVIEFVAGLFGDVSFRPADVVLSRAVRMANANPHRKHPGVLVRISAPVIDAKPTTAPSPTRKVNGGAL